MRTTAFASSLLSAAIVANAQLAYDPVSSGFKCAKPNGIYCAGDSLKQTIIVHCKDGLGVPACCTSELSSLPPLGLKSAALCFQSTSIAGDAACSINGTAFPYEAAPYALPAPVKPVVPVPAVISLGDTPPKGCGCHNGTHPLGPAGPTGPIAPPPPTLPSMTPIAPVKPPVGPVVPPPSGSPVWPIMPSGSAAPFPYHSSKPPTPTSLGSTWRPTPTPTHASVTPAKPIFTGAATSQTVPALALVLGFAALLL